ncbi:MAG: ammonium transporter [Sinimarinibacterium sp.]
MYRLPLCLLLAVVPLPALAGVLEAPADIAWTCTAAALVFFMQAGFALLEGGMSRAKNSVNVIMKNYADMCYGVFAFWAVGYGLMFGSSQGWLGLDHFVPDLDDNSDAVFFIFQLMFAATAATIVSGAMAERTRFGAYVIASMVVTGLIYPVFGAWAWGSYYDGSGWLKAMGFIDFAGSTVVHSVGAWSALAGVIVLGPRLGRFGADGRPRMIPGHNLPMIALGGFILWLGWFGFNGGSTLAANRDVGIIATNTHLAGAAGFAAALAVQNLLRQPILMTLGVNGAIGGLVAITAPCATVTPAFALLIGAVAGVLTVLGATLLDRLQLDDAVGAIPVHGFCGAWGTLAAGLFFKGDLFNLDRIVVQLIGIATAFIWTFPIAFVVFWGLKKSIGLRVNSLHEQRGLDFTEHYEIGYPEFQKDLTHAGKS